MPIVAITSALPAGTEDADAIAAAVGADPSFITDKVGVSKRHILAADESGVDLGEQASQKLFKDGNVDPKSIDLLVYVTQTPDYAIPHNSALLAERLGLRPDVAAFDINLGCSGYVYALSVVEHFLAGEGLEVALLVTCDPYSKIIANEDRGTNAVFGDAAAATLMSRSEGRIRLGRCDYGTDGSGYRALIREAGGAKNPPLNKTGGAEPVYDRDMLRLQMRGREVFDFVMRRVPNSVKRCLEKNSLELESIDRFAFHQGSRQMLLSLTRHMGIPQEKVLINIERYANTVSSTIPMLLEEELQRPTGGAERLLMVSGFGVGLSWATNVIWMK